MDAREFTTLIPRLLIRLYQVLRVGFPKRCRFYPSCSEYTLQAFQANGLFKGLGLGVLRLSKCHPWHQGGFDPIHHTTRRI